MQHVENNCFSMSQEGSRMEEGIPAVLRHVRQYAFTPVSNFKRTVLLQKLKAYLLGLARSVHDAMLRGDEQVPSEWRIYQREFFELMYAMKVERDLVGAREKEEEISSDDETKQGEDADEVELVLLEGCVVDETDVEVDVVIQLQDSVLVDWRGTTSCLFEMYRSLKCVIWAKTVESQCILDRIIGKPVGRCMRLDKVPQFASVYKSEARNFCAFVSVANDKVYPCPSGEYDALIQGELGSDVGSYWSPEVFICGILERMSDVSLSVMQVRSLVESQLARGFDVNYVTSDWHGNAHVYSLLHMEPIVSVQSSLVLINGRDVSGRVIARGCKVFGTIVVNFEPVGACLPISYIWSDYVRDIDVQWIVRRNCGPLGNLCSLQKPFLVSGCESDCEPLKTVEGVWNLIVSSTNFVWASDWLSYAQACSLPFSAYYSFKFLELARLQAEQKRIPKNVLKRLATIFFCVSMDESIFFQNMAGETYLVGRAVFDKHWERFSGLFSVENLKEMGSLRTVGSPVCPMKPLLQSMESVSLDNMCRVVSGCGASIFVEPWCCLYEDGSDDEYDLDDDCKMQDRGQEDYVDCESDLGRAYVASMTSSRVVPIGQETISRLYPRYVAGSILDRMGRTELDAMLQNDNLLHLQNLLGDAYPNHTIEALRAVQQSADMTRFDQTIVFTNEEEEVPDLVENVLMTEQEEDVGEMDRLD